MKTVGHPFILVPEQRVTTTPPASSSSSTATTNITAIAVFQGTEKNKRQPKDYPLWSVKY
jgi:hypothetical protein